MPATSEAVRALGRWRYVTYFRIFAPIITELMETFNRHNPNSPPVENAKPPKGIEVDPDKTRVM